MNIERAQDPDVARLSGLVRENEPGAGSWTMSSSRQCGGARDEAVDQHRQTVLCAGEVGPRERDDLEASEAAEGLNRIAAMRGVELKCASNDFGLAGDSRCIEPVPGPQVLRRQAEKCAGERGRVWCCRSHHAANEEGAARALHRP